MDRNQSDSTAAIDPLPTNSLMNLANQVIDVQWLHKIPLRSELHALDSFLGRPIAGQQLDRRVWIIRFDALENLDTA
jgi:hypothetical protein